MRKIRWMVSVTAVTLAIAAALLFAGCPTAVSSDPDEGDGVLGQVAGVVYDIVDGRPIADAVVTVPGYEAVKTGIDGSYLIKDVTAGTYTATIVKEGYAFISRTVFVDPNAYNTIDPFKENAVLSAEVALFTQWLQSAIPEYDDTSSVTNLEWTYNDGVYVSSDGAKVTYNEAEKKFVWSDKKLNYTYAHAVPLGLVALAPLNASLTANIELVFAPYNDKADMTAPVKNVAPIAAGVKVWLLDTTAIGQTVGDAPSFEPPYTNIADKKALYGPFLTVEGGGFTADKLPARTAFTLLIDRFIQDYDGATFYFDNNTFYAAPEAGGALTDVTDVGLTTNSGEAAVNAGKLYLFTEGDVAFVTASNVNNAGAPLGVGTAITLTFSKDIDTASFQAYISNISNTGAVGLTDLPLKAVWSTTAGQEKKTVSLTPDAKFGNYSAIKLPYSTVETEKIGDLVLNGKAIDSSGIYSGSLPVYTEGGLKLLSIETVAPDQNITRAAYTVAKGGTIKLTFNKPVAVLPTDSFTLGGKPAYYKVDGSSIYVWVDDVLTGTVDLGYPVIYAGGDSSDSIATGTIAGISSAEGKRLVLIKTNLYDDLAGVATAVPDHNLNNFALDGAIELEFAAIPADSRVNAQLWADDPGGDYQVQLNSTATGITGNKVTITPAAPLKYDTTYGLKVRIENSGAALWETPSTTDSLVSIADGIGTGASIDFSTVKIEQLVLIKTNLYDDPAEVKTAAPTAGLYNFALDGAVELEFADIPAGSRLNAQLWVDDLGAGYQVPVTAAINGNKVTVTPAAALKYETTYGLKVLLTNSSGVALWELPNATDSLVLINDSGIGGTKSIEFSTVKVKQLVLAGTNLYDDPDSLATVVPGANANFAPNGAIELEFTEAIPAAATVTAQLWADGPPYVLVYSTAAKSGNKVTITPAANLKYRTTYGVKVVIKDGGNIIWETPTAGTSLVSVDNIGPGPSIQFSTVAVLAVQAINPGVTKTNIDVAGGTSIDANGDIYLDFDRPLKALGTNAAKLIYTTTGGETPATVTLEGNNRILKIAPANLLAPSAGFRLKLDVESVDGQKYVRDSDRVGNPDDFATGTSYNTDITFSTAVTVRWGSGLKPTVAAAFALVARNQTVSKTATEVTLRLSDLTPSLVGRNFNVYRTIYNSTTPVYLRNPTVTVAKGATAPANFTADLDAGIDHLDAENQIFYIRGVDDFGQVIAAQVGPINFAD